ncbi:MAG: cobalt transporter, partial [Desulfobulbaceae bacterium]|nr:cobalt transporter [Desulfobulbaceae bacterium]
MLRNLMFIACVTGLVAGIFSFVAQEVSQVPLILEAETYENSGATGGGVDVVSVVEEEEAWAPEDGFERKFYTFITNI